MRNVYNKFNLETRFYLFSKYNNKYFAVASFKHHTFRLHINGNTSDKDV